MSGDYADVMAMSTRNAFCQPFGDSDRMWAGQGCEGAKVRRCEGAKVRRCEGAKVRRCEGAKVRGCEGARVRGGLPRRSREAAESGPP